MYCSTHWGQGARYHQKWKTSIGEKPLWGRSRHSACFQADGRLRWIDCFPLWSLWLIAVVALTTCYIRVLCMVCGCALCVHACWQRVCHCPSNAVVCVGLLCLAALGNPLYKTAGGVPICLLYHNPLYVTDRKNCMCLITLKVAMNHEDSKDCVRPRVYV